MSSKLSRLSRAIPVIDYEPPAYGGPPVPPAVEPAAAADPRPRPSTPAPPAAPDEAARAAALFADAALRRVLEVIDRRRPLAQLRPLLAAGLADSLLPVVGRTGGGAARLRRVVAQSVAGMPEKAEVAAGYVRGDRAGAIACRVERVPTATGPRWQVVALHIG